MALQALEHALIRRDACSMYIGEADDRCSRDDLEQGVSWPYHTRNHLKRSGLLIAARRFSMKKYRTRLRKS